MAKAISIEAEEDRAANAAQGVKPARKVFFLLDSLNLGGTESQTVELARRLDPVRYRVTLGCLRTRGPLRERLQGSPVEVVEFYPEGGIDSLRGAYQVARLAIFLRRGHFEIFHSHDLWSNLMGVPAAWVARVPVVISSRRDLGHLDWYRTRKRPWLRRMQRLSSMVVANAEAIRESLVAEDGLAPGKVRVLHNAVDVERFSCAPGERERLFPGAGESKLVVLVGNMHSDVKGHPWLIAAAPAILSEFPQTHFVLVGDGEQRRQYERDCEKLGVRHNVIFLGQRTDVPEILACCDLAVLPSRAEGLSNALLEYMAAGLPIVARAVGGNVEVIRNDENGLLAAPQNEGALAGAILRLLRDSALARRLAKRGQDSVRQNFSYERLLEQVDELYSELLAQREAPGAA